MDKQILHCWSLKENKRSNVRNSLQRGKKLGYVLDRWPVDHDTEVMIISCLMERYGDTLKKKFRPKVTGTTEALTCMFRISNWLTDRCNKLTSKIEKLLKKETKELMKKRKIC